MARQKVAVQRVIGGRIYKREIGQYGFITSNETATHLKITIRHLRNLVKDGKLEPVKRKGRLWFRWRDAERLKSERG